jgi:hypothetical protein
MATGLCTGTEYSDLHMDLMLTSLQDSEEMAIPPSYGRDMTFSFVNRPRSVASWHDPDPSTAAARWLAGIAQVEPQPQGSIVQQTTTRAPEEHSTLTVRSPACHPQTRRIQQS